MPNPFRPILTSGQLSRYGLRAECLGSVSENLYLPVEFLYPHEYTNPFILRHTYQTAVVNMMGGAVEFKTVTIEKPEDVNFVLGQSHFIKTVEDIYEAVAGSVPGAKFGLAFCESSGDRLVRIDGNDEESKALARDNAVAIGAGHSFILFLRDCFPINVLNAIKNIQEVCTIYCATANPAEVVIAESTQGRGIMGVIDGERPKGVEGPDGIAWRTGLLRKFGYKRGYAVRSYESGHCVYRDRGRGHGRGYAGDHHPWGQGIHRDP